MKTPAKTFSASSFSRRSLLKRIGAGALAVGAAGLPGITRAEDKEDIYKVTNGRIRQSVVYWCFKPMPPVELADHAASMGMASVELVPVEVWPELRKRGLVCAMASSHGFAKGFAQKDEQDECIKVLTERIDDCAAAGFEKVITFSGYRKGLSTDEAMHNMIEGLKKIVGYAEKKKVTLCLEMLNSRVHINMKGHPDYFCDNVDMSIELIKQIGSERMKLLFDIYHVQIMHGDIITRIKEYHPYVAHYHTAGNPGRNELDLSQEISYPGIMKAILETGYKGFVGQEFIPTRDPVKSLNEAVKLCDV